MSDTEHLTQIEAAERLGISTWKLRQLSNDGLVPRNDDKSYPWPAVRQAFEDPEDNDRKSDAETSGEGDGSEPASGSGADQGEDLTQKEAAARLEISPRTLRRLSNQELVPRNDDKSYPWPAVREAYQALQEDSDDSATDHEEAEESGGDGDPAEQLTQKEAATRLGITPRRLRQLTAETKVTRNEDGSYPWPTVQEEYDAYRATVEDTPDLKAERARWTRARADAQEMDNAIRRGELIAVDDVEEMLRQPLAKVNAITKALPERYGPELAKKAGISIGDAKEIMGEISESIRDQLRDVPAA